MTDILNWLLNLWQTHGPGEPVNFVIAGMVGLLTFLVRSIVITQRDITKTLNNHFTDDRKLLEEISGHMAAQNEVLRVLSGDVMRAALRAPDTVAVHIPVTPQKDA